MRPKKGKPQKKVYSVCFGRGVVAWLKILPKKRGKALFERVRSLQYNPPPAGEAQALDEQESYWVWTVRAGDSYVMIYHKNESSREITILGVSYAQVRI